MSVIDRALTLLRYLPLAKCRMAEVGVWAGELSEQLLRRHEALTLYMVDWWRAAPEGHPYRNSGSAIALRSQADHEAAMAEAEARTRFAGNRRGILHGASMEMASTVPVASLDLAFIDDDHSYSGVMVSLGAWLPNIKRGGYIAGHDYGHPEQGKVKEAVQDFRSINDIRSRLILEPDRIWFWRVR